MRRLADVCQERMSSWMLANNPAADDLADVMPGVVGAYAQSAALLAADWYNDQDGDASFFAAPFDVLSPERMDNTAQWVHAGPQAPESRARVAANTLVWDAARQTLYQNARLEGVAVVRQEYADACNDCVVRATLSPRARDSGADSIATDFHHSCSGMLVPVRRGVWEPPSHAREWRERISEAINAGNMSADTIALWLDKH